MIRQDTTNKGNNLNSKISISSPSSKHYSSLEEDCDDEVPESQKEEKEGLSSFEASDEHLDDGHQKSDLKR